MSLYTLIICEKPDAARRIAQALGRPIESNLAGISVFDVEWNRRHYKVCTALGHLYGLSDSTKNKSVYPALDLEWTQIAKNPKAIRAIKVISDLSKNAVGFVHACDYDQEGEVIGYNILEYACNGKYSNALRAKFSTLTGDEIKESFTDLSKPNRALAQAGRSRHVLDFIYGVNLSRALAKSFKASNHYYNLSIGRVQGPTLAFAVDREKEIRLHVPDPYWTIVGRFSKRGQSFDACYEKAKIEKLAEAESIVKTCTGSEGTVRDVNIKRIMLYPPTPFNIGDLQREAYRLFKILPGYTLSIAERMYLQALISYPRTSSQKLPPSIGYGKVISGISKIESYSSLAAMLLSRSQLIPNEGKMTDPAHPAIYPTGIAPSQRLGALEFKIYDLIVKRFLATFGHPATSQHTKVPIDVKGYIFNAEGSIPLYEGWMVFYKPYIKLEHNELPELKQGEKVKNYGIELEEKFAQPPHRYNQASLLAKMEQERIGTKATRADIIATLFKRNYIAIAKREGIEVTDLGFAVIDSMKAFVPAIVSVELTRTMEEQLERVEQGYIDNTSVIEQAVDRLIESLSEFMKKESDIGKKIADAASSSNIVQASTTILGPCPICKNGQLRIIHSRTTKKRFVGCSNYANGCKASAPLPQKGNIRRSGEACQICCWPVIGLMFARRSKQWKICINSQCSSKKPHNK